MKTIGMVVVMGLAAVGCSAETAEEHATSGESAMMVQDLHISYEQGPIQSELDQETHATFGGRLEVRDTSLSVDDDGNIDHGSIQVTVNGAAGADGVYRAPYRLGVAAAVLARCGAGGWHLVEYTEQKASWGREDLHAEWHTLLGGIGRANVHCNREDVELGLGVWYGVYTYAPAAPTGERAPLQRWHCFPRAACSAVSATSE
jgi:hypothetical protein